MADESTPTRIIQITDQERDKDFPFIGNSIKTTRYNLLTFLPKNLFEQFRRLANFYFLIVIILEYFPFSPLNPTVSVLPLIFVLTITAIREAYEDAQRRKSDKKINNTVAVCLRNGSFKNVKWKDIQVGDIIKVQNGQFFPADIVILSTSEPMSMCYIDTCNLDGETNLKIRQGLQVTSFLAQDEAALSNFHATVQSELPNNRLYNFDAALDYNDETHSLSNQQMLLRGCALRNTKWVIGTVVFTGFDSKIMKNSTRPPSKRSTVEKQLNSRLISIFIFLGIIGIIGAVFASRWQDKYGNSAWYMGDSVNKDNLKPAVIGVYAFFSFIIVCNVMIPISLYVTMEMVKLIQTVFINHDIDMYHDETDTPAKARTSNLSEELGIIEYIFSDKTGTLTCNMMEFMKCTISGISYGNGVTEVAVAAAKREGRILEITRNKDDPAFDDDSLLNNLHNKHETAGMIHEFLTMLSVCHTVIPEKDPKNEGEIIYQASSPDEGALVEAGKLLGFRFHSRTPSTVTVEIEGKDETFEILNVLEFNSRRKRMSVIVKTSDGTIKLYTKGADNMITQRLAPESKYLDETTKHLEMFANEGLRTLCFAMKVIPQDEYEKWNEGFHKANISIEKRKEKLEQSAEEIERNLLLVGASAIEDKLQEGVPEAIELLARAGIKIWVLTGDKQETAINIGFACSLLTTEMTLITISAPNLESTQEALKKAIKEHSNSNNDNIALVIDGATLEFALDGIVKFDLLQLGKMCKAVICCRVSPLQKALVVKLVRDNVNAITLAIGDGANDVSMIQSAHVGIGISGQEGMQAVLASDYAIAQFRFLKKLILVHGRYSYRRITKLIVYSFYKNMAFSIMQVYFSIFAAWSAQTLFDSLLISIFNVVFSSLPIVVISVFDQDVSQDAEIAYPQLYSGGDREFLFGFTRFWLWLLQGVYQGAVLFFVPFLLWRYEPLSDDGIITGLWGMSTGIYTSLIIAINLKIAIETTFWTWMHHVTIWGSIIVWFVFAIVYNLILKAPTMYYVVFHTLKVPVVWLQVLFTVVLCLLPDFFIKYYSRNYRPQDWHIIQERERLGQQLYKPTATKSTMAIKDEIELSDINVEDDTKLSKPTKTQSLFAEKVINYIVDGKPEKFTGFAFSVPRGSSFGVVAKDRTTDFYETDDEIDDGENFERDL
ncbi:putative phospholipid-transporting atpase [Anaeramoeba ignava]|uniref:Phospholipid-transporting ATPase n=1 Tax=Anaeramoeba ignava TaxID=1746090 RepID=A0A9Q0LHV6_ANAIG|nr:putative phospholipid-transporting atpase [Anaeramoeba ignava]|eukprot:Anaeramoba_ignava/a607691_138.p1 GENE.a607691_138~~a607691_138.p1  ORF type:complete len:1170 (+),score=279.50 a607691_138:35-3544(+)